MEREQRTLVVGERIEGTIEHLPTFDGDREVGAVVRDVGQRFGTERYRLDAPFGLA